LTRVRSSTIKESDSIPELIRPVIVSLLGPEEHRRPAT
jgi:hypothetical protein